MEGTFSVRKAITTDLWALVALMKDFSAEADFELDERQAMQSISELLSQEAFGSVWIASKGPEPIGHAVLNVRHTMEHSGLSGYIDDLFAKPGYRRRGVASVLLRELEKECLDRKCRALVVEVGKNNPAGLEAYKRFGMRHISDGRITCKKMLHD